MWRKTTSDRDVEDTWYFKMPKVELHCHLEGSFPFSLVVDEYRRQGIPLPSDDEAALREYFLIERPSSISTASWTSSPICRRSSATWMPSRG
ncbi:unnamed protein product [Vitrella brassicaformis CCMP3155]|uniref:Adenosine deaminase domain-containing protein n=1 Tax=Vitrella brassicaformis (strain CCMP3155) TaxID=1169540 RepID=A0A0G4EAD4_VITBC|nr:unnamed protein product [Vitrella brassicaformis CCMP3155]|eukprot:CEL92914.1 unnamed protein product [Vitrella brassicaformis CCMP3155]